MTHWPHAQYTTHTSVPVRHYRRHNKSSVNLLKEICYQPALVFQQSELKTHKPSLHAAQLG